MVLLFKKNYRKCAFIGFLVALGIQTSLAINHIVLIDPGHGGVYAGEYSLHNAFAEKHVVLKIAKKLRPLLKKAGYTVILTRTSDIEFDKNDLISDLSKRAALTAHYKADIFVSLHLNKRKNSKARGFEVYVPYETKYPVKSYALASACHYELSHKITPNFSAGKLHNVNVLDGGIKAAKFNVLKKAHCPAVLLELDFMSNPQSERKLMTDAYLDKLAHAVFCGIKRYFREMTGNISR